MPEEIDDFEQIDNSNMNTIQQRVQKSKKVSETNNKNIRKMTDMASNSTTPKSSTIVKKNNTADKLTGGNTSKVLGKTTSVRNKLTSGGKNQKLSNKMSESGLSNKLSGVSKGKNKKLSDKIDQNKLKNKTLNNSNKNKDIIDNEKELDDNNNSNTQNKEQKSKGLKSKLDKLSNSGKKNKNIGIKNVAAEAIKKILKPIKTKLIMSIGTLVAGLAVCFFVIYMILSPLIDIWPYVDGTVRSGANFTEKFLNFFRGFGFQDSEKAFYDETEALNKFYDNSLDMPLLLETIFYPETQNYGIDYDEHLAVDNNDPITATISGGPSGFVNFAKNWIKDAVVNESNNTYSENGLIYNANKIYRLRRLAAAMADRDGPVEEVTLGQFLDILGDKFSIAIKNVIGSIIGLAVDGLKDVLDLLINEIVDLVTLDFDAMAQDFKGFFQNIKDSAGNVAESISQLITVLSFGFCSIEKISFHPITGSSEDLSLITISYKKFRFNKEKYDDYLMNHYFENTIEYAKLLPEEEKSREQAKIKILNEIYMNKEAFEELFVEREDGTGEKYAYNCEGAIDNKIVKQLTLPIDVPVGKTFNFSNNDLFGIVNGYKQNGVILNSLNSGITTGQNVFSVYGGEIIEIHHKTNDNQLKDDQNSNWIKIEHKVDTDNDPNTEGKKVYTVYKYLGSISPNLNVGDHVLKGQAIGTVGEVSITNNNLVGDTLAERIWWALLNAGFSKEVAAGMLGNMAVECGGHTIDGIKTDSIEGEHDFEKMMASGRGFGLIGWTASAFKQAFREYLKAEGGNWYDEDVQIGFLIETTKTADNNRWKKRFYNVWESEGYTYEKFINASTPEIAAEQYCRLFEKGPSYTYNQIRSTQARVAYDRFKNKTMPVSSQNSSTVPGIYFEFQNSEKVPINPNNLFIKCAGAYDFIWPTENAVVTDIFGNRYEEMQAHRDSYGEGGSVLHYALDIKNSRGEPYYAVCDGIIENVNSTSYHITELNCGMDSNNEEVHIIYEHGDAVASLKKGDTVQTGQKLGTSNGWGITRGPNSFRPHLHFQVYTTNSSGSIKFHNPLIYLYGMSYDGKNDGNMTCNIAKYDGSILNSINASNYSSNGLNSEQINFMFKYGTGTYDQSDIYNKKGNFYN